MFPDFDNPITWSILGMFCMLPLIAEAASFTRVLFITRQPLWRYLFVALPLGVSLGFFGVVLNAFSLAWNNYGSYWMWFNGREDEVITTSLHFNTAMFLQMRNAYFQIIGDYQLQVAVTLVAFILMLVLEKQLLPRVKRPPVWVLRRERAI